MRAFLDTNIFIEYFARRTEFAYVRQILAIIYILTEADIKAIRQGGLLFVIFSANK